MAIELLRQVRVLNPFTESDRIADVLIVEGRIESMGDRLETVPDDAQIYDRPGLILAPGLVDLYSHSGEPGFESRETLDSLSQAALAGGFTRLTLLPDTNPPLDTPASLNLMRSRVKSMSSDTVQIGFWGSLTVGSAGTHMAELGDLAAAGVIGLADSLPLQQWGLIRRLLEYAQPLNLPIALWAYHRELAGNGVLREGPASIQLGLPGDPAMSETAALAALLECIAAIQTPVHLMRISTKRGVELIRDAKERGTPITASTTWMHLVCSSEDAQSYDPSLRLAPPLGNSDDRQALIEGLREGVLDAIAIDHSPYTYEEKMVSFAETPPGAIGLELALPLLWQTLVAQEGWSALSLWNCLSVRPCHCLGKQPPVLMPMSPAELVLFDPDEPWQVTPNTLKSLSINTPWLGQSITGKVVKTWAGKTGHGG
ncbi:MAG: dihydroorotase [Elainellaceae cyanobacterium]